MGAIKNKLDTLEKRLYAMIPPGNEPVVFIFPDGRQMDFCNGHEALIFAIKNRKNVEMQGVTVETKKQGVPLLAKAVLAGDPKKKTKGDFEK